MSKPHDTKQVRKEFHYKLFKNPPELFVALGEASAKKAHTEWYRVLLLGVMAGIFVGFGGSCAYATAGGIPSTTNTSWVAQYAPVLPRLITGLTFPVALILILTLGGELFTGNAMIMSLGTLARKVTWVDMLKSWGVSYVGNYIGTHLMALMLWGTGLWAKDPWHAYLFYVAEHKVAEDFGVMILRGILANTIVCSAYGLAVAAEDIGGKIVAIYVSILIFVVAGFEHSIANMFFVPVAIFYGADVYYYDFLWKNLLPVTIGNLIGASVMLSLPYWFLYYVQHAPKSLVKHDPESAPAHRHYRGHHHHHGSHDASSIASSNGGTSTPTSTTSKKEVELKEVKSDGGAEEKHTSLDDSPSNNH